MSFRNSNTSQGSDDFHGLKEANMEPDVADVSDERKEKKKEVKKFLFKKDSKDKGYSTLSADQSQDSVFLVNTKNSKKPKHDNKIATLNVFKKSFKDDKRLKDIKESKEVSKRGKKNKDRTSESHVKEHLFGNYFENSVASFPCIDGVKIPYPIRICLDLLEQKEIENETIYRKSVNKSQLESICESINSGRFESRLEEINTDPNLACAIIKKFLRELKSPLISEEFINLFDKCDSSVSDKDLNNKIDHFKRLIAKMPQPNLDTFSYLIMHFHRFLNKNEYNKIEIGLFVQKFQPMFRIRERLFKFMVTNADSLFSDYRFKKYRTKTNDETTSRFSTLPDNIEDLEQEISRQEIYLSKLHSRIANEEKSTDKTLQEQLCEELWNLQRYVTSLKRRVKKLKMERKLLETEQLKSSNTGVNQVPASNSNSTIKNEDISSEINCNSNPALINDDLTSNLSQMELYNKETNIICENNVIIETIQQLFDKIKKEKYQINDIQSKLFNRVGSANFVLPIPSDISMLSLHDLYNEEQLIINENKLLEERINLINKRINGEKEKIFELKLNINLKTIENEQQMINNQMLMANKKSVDLHLIGKINLTDKELIMTKL